MRWPFVSRRERLRREAADWVARLNGPYDEKDRAEFERWYNSDPDHAAAYDRVAALFDAAGRARRPNVAAAEFSAEASRSRSRPIRYALAAAVAGAALLAFVLLSARTVSPIADGRQQFAAFSAPAAESRRIVLLDRSEVLLSPGSRLDVAIGRSERRLRLVHGEGRFTVAHEARPFIVAADGTEVVARGTRFVVRVADGGTTVSLIEGRVDVSHSTSPDGERRVTRLEPGQRLVVQKAAPAARSRVAPAPAELRPRPRRDAMLQFDDTPLGQAVEQVNRHGRPRVRLADPGIADLRVSGAFRAGDMAGFAESVAAAFDLELERGPDATLWLRPRPPN